MVVVKPTLEKVNPGFGKSILVRNHVEFDPKYKASWHFHPEIELVYVDNGKGKRHIGNHLSYFSNSQLILIGSNLPHNGFTDRLTANGQETLIQFHPEIFGQQFYNLPEMTSINYLFERAKKGILFKSETKNRLGTRIKDLHKEDDFNRLIKLLEILYDLSQTEDYELLNVDGFAFETNPSDSARIDRIFNFINDNFTSSISLEVIADEVSMTVPAFCRYFKKATGKTFTKLVNEYRVVHATKLLSESEKGITDICFECGFNNFSHFNKQFKEITGKSASQYRNEKKRMLH